MKKILGSALGLCAFFTLAVPRAEALLVAHAIVNDANAALNSIPADLYHYSNDALTPLNTSISDFNGNIARHGSNLYFTDESGFKRVALGGTPTTLRASSKLTSRASSSRYIIIDDASNKGALIYDMVKHKTQRLPDIRTVLSADFSVDGKHLVILGKNRQKKTVIFYNTTSLFTFGQKNLPRDASSCTNIATIPSDTQFSLICGAKSGGTKTFIFRQKHGAIVQTGTIHDASFSPSTATWVNNGTLITIGLYVPDPFNAFNFIVQAREYLAVNGQPRQIHKYNIEVTPSVGTGSYLFAPYNIERTKNTEAAFTVLYLGTTDAAQSIIASVIGKLDINSQTTTLTVNDGSFNIFTDVSSDAS